MGNTHTKEEDDRRFALIIHNDQFNPESGLGFRSGNHVDVLSAQCTLNKLGFIHDEAKNCTADDIKAKIDNVCTDANYSKYSCLVIVVMTHGSSGGVLYASDTHYNTSDIWTLLTKSQNFANKPKLLFIQACRGNDSEGMSGNQITPVIQNNNSTCQPYDPNSEKSEHTVTQKMSLLPQDQHFFLSFSTIEDKKAIRNQDEGTWYIQTLCNIVNGCTKGTKNDLISLMTKLTYDIIYREEGYIAQTPSYISFLPYTVTFTLDDNNSNVPDATPSTSALNRGLKRNLSDDSGYVNNYLSQLGSVIEFDGTGSNTNVKYLPSHYEWRRKTAGKCLVFYDEMHECTSSKMGQLFCDMTYDTEVIKISSNTIVTKLQQITVDFSKLNNDESPDSLIVVILAKLIAPEEQSQDFLRHEDSHVAGDTCISDTWSSFIASQCESLLRRPKIFFYLDNRNVKDSDTPEDTNLTKSTLCTNDHQDFFFVYGYGEEFINCLVDGLREGYQKRIEVHLIVTKAIHDARQILDSKDSSSAVLNTRKLPYFKSTLSLQLIFGHTRNIDKENCNARQLPSTSMSTSDGCFPFLKRVKRITHKEAFAIDSSGNTSLHLAARNGDLNTLQQLIDLNVDVHAKNNEGQSAIYFAVKNERLEIVQFLVEYGKADVNVTLKDGETLLQGACLHCAVDIVRYLLEKGAKVDEIRPDGDTALQVASAYGKFDIVKLLVEYGADVHHKKCNDDTTALHMASFCSVVGTYECVQYLIEQGVDVNVREMRGFTPLQLAVRKSDMEKIQLLIDNGADIHSKSNDGANIFQSAIEYRKDIEILDYLLHNGADIYNIRSDGATSLHIASQFGKIEHVKWLLKNQYDTNIQMFDGKTSLHLAAERGHLECVKLLIENGANINIRKFNGDTMLHVAVESGKLEICKYLVELGANINDINCNEWLPIHKAAQKGCVDIVLWLLQLGASIDAKNDVGEDALQIAQRCKKFKVLEILKEQM